MLSSCFHHCQSSDTNKLNFQNRKNNWQLPWSWQAMDVGPMARILPKIRPITRCVPLCTADLKFSPCLPTYFLLSVCYGLCTFLLPLFFSPFSPFQSGNNNATPIENTDKKKFQRKSVVVAHSFNYATRWSSSTTVAYV